MKICSECGAETKPTFTRVSDGKEFCFDCLDKDGEEETIESLKDELTRVRKENGRLVDKNNALVVQRARATEERDKLQEDLDGLANDYDEEIESNTKLREGVRVEAGKILKELDKPDKGQRSMVQGEPFDRNIVRELATRMKGLL